MAADALRELKRRRAQLEVLAAILETVGEGLSFYLRRRQQQALSDPEEQDASALAVRKGRVEASMRETEQRISELQGVSRG